MTNAQKLQEMLENEDLTLDEALALPRTDPRGKGIVDLLEGSFVRTYVFCSDGSALDSDEGIAVKFTRVVDGDIMETTYLDGGEAVTID
jgi:hypothetical protein